MSETDRREFLMAAGLGLAGAAAPAAATAAAPAAAAAASKARGSVPPMSRQGPKEVVRGKRAVASSQSPIVTQAMLDTLRAGGNAVDAVICGSIVQATVQPEMTNHAGTVSALVHDAKTGRIHYLNSTGTLHPTLPPFRPHPPGLGGLATGSPMACLPGFMPGMKALHERFGSKSWKSLVEPAIPWAEDGFPVDEFQRSLFDLFIESSGYFPDMRALFAPEGFSPSVGVKLRNPALASTLRGLADEGPDHFTQGAWARAFVARAHELGWKIQLSDLSANPPRWVDPIRYPHKQYEIVQPAPPERQALFCCIVLGILRHLDVSSLGHYTESAESLYYMAQALRRAEFELGMLHDPQFFETPLDVWMSDDHLASLAAILKRSRPKAGVDLTTHVQLTSHPGFGRAFGWNGGAPAAPTKQPPGSCELSCVDAQGNWVQTMNTLQAGGIPGMVVGGVPMWGTHAQFGMSAGIHGWLGLPGSRIRCVMSNTMVLRDGRPWLSMGSPGNVFCTVPQMLSNVLDYPYDPYDAAVLPRMLPMADDYGITIETRIPERVVRDLAKLGATVRPRPAFDVPMGSYQQAWRDPVTGLLSASTDPRRAGVAGGY
jgi:gamma-glutamyltranspeptidase/glutathione hydrolase